MSKDSSQRPVIIALVDQGSNPFELACLTEVLGIDRPELDGPLYDFRMCASRPEVLMRQGFFTMTGIGDLSALQHADTVIVPNRPDTSTPYAAEVLDAIAQAHARGTRMVGMCSGAFPLAEAGVLNGRRATVHWQWTAEFRARFPQVEIDDAVLFVDDGDILTSAGSAAALDLALHLVRRDHGAEVGASVARRLVFHGHRPGGQQQFIDRPIPKEIASPLAPAIEWAKRHSAEPISVANIAARASMSVATVHRRFRAELGCTPGQWLTNVRVEHARRLLEQTDLPIEQVPSRCGLGTPANLRLKLVRETGLSPTSYRRAFS